MRIGICDDEKQQRGLLGRMLAQALQLSGATYTIEEFEDGTSLVNQVASNPERFDVLFLDIEMGDVNGVDVARGIRRYTKNVILIFVTGYADYVFNGYEVDALDYVLKPCKPERIKRLVEKIAERTLMKKELFLPVQHMGRLQKIPVSSILYLTSDLRKITIVMNTKNPDNAPITCYGKLSEYEAQLPAHFIRIHQRYLVNLSYVDEADAASVRMGQVRLPVSKRRSPDVMSAFARYIVEGEGMAHE